MHAVMNEGAKDLIALSGKTFGKRLTLLNLWQEIAEQFYPERADFTYRRSLGTEFADHLMDSYPSLVRRDLGNSISSILRPSGQDWFEMTVSDMDHLDHGAKAWLEWATKRQKMVMYDRAAQFTRATKEGDHDFAAFGQCVIHATLNQHRSGMIYRNHHMRDVAWCENVDGKIDLVFRKWEPYASDLKRLFGDKCCTKIDEMVNGKKAYQEVHCQHMVVPAERYPEAADPNFPFVSLHIDMDHQHVMEAVPSRRLQYVIPRWQTVSGSQYAYSPATITALSDARLIQAMTLVLLEAGEVYVRPPMVAVEEVIRSDVALYAGGVTWVDKEYDEKLGEALRPVAQNRTGAPMSVGLEMSALQKQQIVECFYINKLSLPPMTGDQTAYEIAQRVQEYIRQAMPLFEPMEMEYNGALCEETFDELLWSGVFGSPMEIPESLQGSDIEFKFRSPLRDSEGQATTQKFMQASQILGVAAEIQPGVGAHVNITKAFRDAIEGTDAPVEWLVDEKEAEAAIAAENEKAAQAQALAMAGEAANIAETAGRAGQEMAKADEAAQQI